MNSENSDFILKPYVYKLGYIILYIPSLNIAPQLTIDGETLFAKDKFHMSILGVKEYIVALADKLKISPEEAEKKIIEESKKILEETPINFVRFKDDIRLVEEEDEPNPAVSGRGIRVGSLSKEVGSADKNYPYAFHPSGKATEDSGGYNKKTIVIMCEADGVESFFDKLRNVLKIEISTQPVHATIYTRRDGRGIGMVNQKELSDFSRSLTDGETIIVKKALDWDNLNQF